MLAQAEGGSKSRAGQKNSTKVQLANILFQLIIGNKQFY